MQDPKKYAHREMVCYEVFTCSEDVAHAIHIYENSQGSRSSGMFHEFFDLDMYTFSCGLTIMHTNYVYMLLSVPLSPLAALHPAWK